MIDVYAAAGTFPDSHTLARDLAAAVMRWEQVPDLPLFANNTAAFVHDMDATAISNVAGASLSERTWVLVIESPEAGWGIAGHANTNADIAAAARAALAAR